MQGDGHGDAEGTATFLLQDTQEAAWASRRTGEGSFEAVENLALQAMLDLTPPQHKLQHLVDGVLRVFLQDTGGCRAGLLQGSQNTPPAHPLDPAEPTYLPAHREPSGL